MGCRRAHRNKSETPYVVSYRDLDRLCHWPCHIAYGQWPGYQERQQAALQTVCVVRLRSVGRDGPDCLARSDLRNYPPGAGRQITEQYLPDPHSNQPQSGVSDRCGHPADLAIPAFDQL
jgi:hypothetical protein